MKHARTPFLVVALAAAVPGQDEAGDDPRPHMRKPLPSAEEIAALPPDGGPEFNRLVFEESPYLLQHCRNPVDWYPWGEEAFAVAAARDVPVFLSIGYSTCHWCHVMEHESFEDPEVAELMNEAFVCVKVDREERPDVDHAYMTVTQAMTGHGGWPMTVILTPAKRPFFAGTYFPKQSMGRRWGMMQLVPALREAWETDRENVLASAQQVTERLAQLTGGAPGEALGLPALARAEDELASRFDVVHGGFGDAPKFPVPHDLRFLLRRHHRTGEPTPLDMVTATLRGWRLGGMFDHVGFGFHRYSTDREWLVPHFEKMLYDQALIALAYVEAWQVTGDPEHQRTAREVLTYVRRDMTSPEGAFYSAEDADSEGEEGLFYLWTIEELVAVLGEEEGRFVARLFQCTAEGNYRDEATGERTGRNILHLERPLAEQAESLGTDAKALAVRWEAARERLFARREERVHPLKDDKVLTDWNGLMIAAFAKAGRAFDEPEFTDAARRAADFLLDELRDDEGRLFKRWRNGEAGLTGLLEDYAFATYGLLELFEAVQEPRYLRAALELTEAQVEHFWDGEAGGFFLSPGDGEALIVRAKEIYDGALPSGNSVSAHNLVRLARLTGRTELEQRAHDVVTAFSGQVATGPSNFSQLLHAVDFLVGPSHEVVLVGEPGSDELAAMRRRFDARFAPNAVLIVRPAGDDPPIAALAPYVAAQRALDGRATAYVCRDFACEAPTADVEVALGHLRPRDEEDGD